MGGTGDQNRRKPPGARTKEQFFIAPKTTLQVAESLFGVDEVPDSYLFLRCNLIHGPIALSLVGNASWSGVAGSRLASPSEPPDGRRRRTRPSLLRIGRHP